MDYSHGSQTTLLQHVCSVGIQLILFSAGGLTHDADCNVFASYLRSRIEDLLYKYKVDLVFGAHKHCYERHKYVMPN